MKTKILLAILVIAMLATVGNSFAQSTPGQGEVYTEVYGTVGIAFEASERSVAWRGIPGTQFTDYMLFNNTGEDQIDVTTYLVPASDAGFFGYADLSVATTPEFWFQYTPILIAPGQGTPAGATYFQQYQPAATTVVTNLVKSSQIQLNLTLQTATNTSVRSELAKIVLEATESDSIENEWLNVETANMIAVAHGTYAGQTNGITSAGCAESAFTYGIGGVSGYALVPYNSTTNCLINWTAASGTEYTYYNDAVDFCINVYNGIAGPVDARVYTWAGVSLCNLSYTATGANTTTTTCCNNTGVGNAWLPAQQIKAQFNMTGSTGGNLDSFIVERLK